MFLNHLCWCFLFPGLKTSILRANCFYLLLPTHSNTVFCPLGCLLSQKIQRKRKFSVFISVPLSSCSLACLVLSTMLADSISPLSPSLSELALPNFFPLYIQSICFWSLIFWCPLLLLIFWTFRLSILNLLKQWQFKL